MPSDISTAILFIVLIVWSSIWKGFALWKAVKNNHLGWYIALFILNTAGIVEIIYIFGFSKKKKEYNEGI
jgi:methionyl-tRNA synthetase